MYRSHTSWLDARRRTAVTERDFRKRDEQKPGSSSMWFPSSSKGAARSAVADAAPQPIDAVADEWIDERLQRHRGEPRS